jgi:hypothetical protein
MKSTWQTSPSAIIWQAYIAIGNPFPTKTTSMRLSKRSEEPPCIGTIINRVHGLCPHRPWIDIGAHLQWQMQASAPHGNLV